MMGLQLNTLKIQVLQLGQKMQASLTQLILIPFTSCQEGEQVSLVMVKLLKFFYLIDLLIIKVIQTYLPTFPPSGTLRQL